MSTKSDRDYDWIGKEDELNMAKHIDEWGDPVEQSVDNFPVWIALLVLVFIWLSGVIVGAYAAGWRIPI
jgi:hypothetical protein